MEDVLVANIQLIAIPTTISIHQDVLTTLPKCPKYGYSHPQNKCPTYGKECFNFGSCNHYTALCRIVYRVHCSAQTPEPEHPGQEVDHAKEREGHIPSATIPVAGAGPAIHPADTPAISKAKAAPAPFN